MGKMKELLVTVYGGGDEAVAAVERMGEDWRAMLEQAARLTDAERASMTRAIETLEGVEYMEAFRAENDATAAAILRGLLERMK